MGEDDYETKSGKGHDDDKGTFREHVVWREWVAGIADQRLVSMAEHPYVAAWGAEAGALLSVDSASNFPIERTQFWAVGTVRLVAPSSDTVGPVALLDDGDRVSGEEVTTAEPLAVH